MRKLNLLTLFLAVTAASAHADCVSSFQQQGDSYGEDSREQLEEGLMVLPAIVFTGPQAIINKRKASRLHGMQHLLNDAELGAGSDLDHFVKDVRKQYGSANLQQIRAFLIFGNESGNYCQGDLEQWSTDKVKADVIQNLKTCADVLGGVSDSVTDQILDHVSDGNNAQPSQPTNAVEPAAASAPNSICSQILDLIKKNEGKS